MILYLGGTSSSSNILSPSNISDGDNDCNLNNVLDDDTILDDNSSCMSDDDNDDVGDVMDVTRDHTVGLSKGVYNK